MNNNKIKLISLFINKAVKVRRIIEQSSTFEDKAITLLQMQTLRFIKTNPGASTGSLAHELFMSPSAVTQLTNRLVNAKLLKRKTDLSDRRVILLFLTDKGEEQIQIFTDQLLKTHFAIFADIPEESLKQMIQIFTNILQSHEDKKII